MGRLARCRSVPCPKSDGRAGIADARRLRRRCSCTENALGLGDNFNLGAAGIGDERMRGSVFGDHRQQCKNRRNRGRQHDHVRILDGALDGRRRDDRSLPAGLPFPELPARRCQLIPPRNPAVRRAEPSEPPISPQPTIVILLICMHGLTPLWTRVGEARRPAPALCAPARPVLALTLRTRRC